MAVVLSKVKEDIETEFCLREAVQKVLYKYNRFRIAEHTLRVADKAKELAKQFEEDETLAEIAGLLHDIGGIFPYDERLSAAKELGLEILLEEEKFPLILHQKLSKVIAQELFNINDESVLSAINCHTTLCADYTTMDMIIFIADKLEWDQEGVPNYFKQVEGALSVSLEYAAFTYIKYKLFESGELKVVHPWLIEAFEDLRKKLKL